MLVSMRILNVILVFLSNSIPEQNRSNPDTNLCKSRVSSKASLGWKDSRTPHWKLLLSVNRHNGPIYYSFHTLWLEMVFHNYFSLFSQIQSSTQMLTSALTRIWCSCGFSVWNLREFFLLEEKRQRMVQLNFDNLILKLELFSCGLLNENSYC